MAKKRGWMIVAYGALALSVASLLLPILVYRNSSGEVTSFNIVDLLTGSDFAPFVFSQYTGSFLKGMSYGTIVLLAKLLCVVGVVAIVLAFVGIRSMSKQYESDRPFRLTMCGLVGTALPSLTLLVLFLLSASHFLGTIRIGAYAIVTPLAMVCACMAVTARHRLTMDEAKAQREARAYIRPAGDLPIVRRGGNYGQ